VIPASPRDASAQREKHRVALASVLAAILLTGAKAMIGAMTGSLGILAEAAHSGLDLAAAALTLFAVRYAGRAADSGHTYGHGKMENLSALFETLLLLATCAWILWEAGARLVAPAPPAVEANAWAFGVVIFSIAIDVSRSRALYRVARQYDSQALEADALHFSTDIWSSAVVLLGLLGVVLADAWGIPALAKADSVAALGVAFIVIGVSLRLGKKTIADLLDSVPPGLRDAVAYAAASVPGIRQVRTVRVRKSGPETFADITATVDYDTAFERVHEITRAVEEAVRAVLPRADVVVHAEPAPIGDADLQSSVRALAARMRLVAHDVRVVDEGAAGRSVDLHLEVERSLSVGQAHAQSDRFEEALRQAHPSLVRITTHLEPAGEDAARTPTLPDDARVIRDAIEASAREMGVSVQAHDVEVKRTAGELTVTFHCALDAEQGIRPAHELTKKLEQALRIRVPDIGRVVIHVEPKA